MSDIVIPEAAIDAAAKAVLGVEWQWGSGAMQQAAVRDARLALEAALPALRRQWAEEIGTHIKNAIDARRQAVVLQGGYIDTLASPDDLIDAVDAIVLEFGGAQ